MVRWINETKAIGLYEAYMLCSCAGDLKISGTVSHSRTRVSMASDKQHSSERRTLSKSCPCCLLLACCGVWCVLWCVW